MWNQITSSVGGEERDRDYKSSCGEQCMCDVVMLENLTNGSNKST